MTPDFATYFFLFGNFFTIIPLIVLSFYLWRSWDEHPTDTALMGRTIFYLTSAKIIFYISQFSSVFLGVLGVARTARIPIILIVDGSLLLVALANWYTFIVIRGIYKRQNKI